MGARHALTRPRRGMPRARRRSADSCGPNSSQPQITPAPRLQPHQRAAAHCRAPPDSPTARPSASSTTIAPDGDQRPDETAVATERSAQHREQRHRAHRKARSAGDASRLWASAIHFGTSRGIAADADRSSSPSDTSVMSRRRSPSHSAGCRRGRARSGAKVSTLSRPVWRSISWRLPLMQQHARTVRSFDQPAALGQNRRVRRLVARIVHQDAVQRAVRIARTHIDRQIVGDLGEHALLQQEGRHAVADLPLELAKCRKTGGHDPEVEHVAADRRPAPPGPAPGATAQAATGRRRASP